MTYKGIIIEALEYFGGHAYYEDIYKYFEINHPEKLSNSNWQASVRHIIETHSSDSSAFKGKHDLFYSVDGLGKGHWGLKGIQADQFVEMTQEDSAFSEGKFYLKQHLFRERNAKLITTAKKQFKQRHGRLYCQVCGFDFEKKYGKLGEDFIEAHHIKPISEMNPSDKTRIEDVIMVCSNCHSMIHRRKPWLKLEEIKSIIDTDD